MAVVSLTARDKELLKRLVADQTMRIEEVASLFFAKHPVNGKPNKDPVHAAKRRLATLAAHGYVEQRRDANGGAFVLAGAKAGAVAGERVTKIHRRHVVHHLIMKECLDTYKTGFEAAGFTVSKVEMEHVVSARMRKEMGGMERGGRVERLADGEITLQAADGTEQLLGIEYATKGYSTSMITEKHNGFRWERRYSKVFWVADRSSTAARVAVVTQEDCDVIG